MPVPQYQEFNKKITDYMDTARKSASGQYDTRIAGERDALPLIQKQYENLANSIKTDQQQHVGSMKQDAESIIGASRMSSAFDGSFSSSQQDAVERNVDRNLDTNVSNLAARVANVLAQNQNARGQQELDIRNTIRNLETEKEGAIGSLARSLYDQDYEKHDLSQRRLIDQYYKDLSIQFQREAAQRQAEMDAFNRRMAEMDLDIRRKESDFDRNTSTSQRTSEIADYINTLDQNTAYSYLQRMAPSLQAEGIDMGRLWNVWRYQKYAGSVPTNVISQGQAAIDQYLAKNKSKSSSSPSRQSSTESRNIYERALFGNNLMPGQKL